VSYKAKQVYIVMRSDDVTNVSIPVAVFNDLDTAEGNAAGYNLDMEERTIIGIKFSVAATMYYE
jgi:hypothetical protein